MNREKEYYATRVRFTMTQINGLWQVKGIYFLTLLLPSLLEFMEWFQELRRNSFA